MAYLTQFSNTVPVIKYHIEQTLMTIGQDFDMDICVPEDGIAENHAVLEAVKDAESYRFTIKSNENESPLNLNGEIVTSADLHDGDWLTIGGVEFQFTDDGVNSIIENITSIPAAIVTEKPELVASEPVKQQVENNVSEALKLIKELKEDLQDGIKPLSTKEFIQNSRHRQRGFAY